MEQIASSSITGNGRSYNCQWTVKQNNIQDNSNVEVTARMKGGSASSMDIRSHFKPKSHKNVKDTAKTITTDSIEAT